MNLAAPFHWKTYRACPLRDSNSRAESPHGYGAVMLCNGNGEQRCLLLLSLGKNLTSTVLFTITRCFHPTVTEPRAFSAVSSPPRDKPPACLQSPASPRFPLSIVHARSAPCSMMRRGIVWFAVSATTVDHTEEGCDWLDCIILSHLVEISTFKHNTCLIKSITHFLPSSPSPPPPSRPGDTSEHA